MATLSKAFSRSRILGRSAFLMLTFFVSLAHADDVPQSFTLDGQLFSDASATTPLLDGSILMDVQILDEDKVCILYEESQSISTLASQGYFTAQVGTATGSIRRPVTDPGNSMATVFQNITAVNGRLVSNGSPCTAAAGAGKRRFVRITISPTTMGSTARVLSPDLTIDSVPNAIVAERAESLQGLRSTDVLKINTTGGSALTQSNLESLFTSATRFNSLTAVVDGTSTNYMRSNSNSGAQLPVLPGAPTTPPIGAVWFDSSDSKIKFQTSVGPTTLGTGSGSVTSVGFTAPPELTVAGAPVTSAGTIAVTWAAQMTNKVLAAPDGSTGTPTFRVLTANDIPSLPWTKITTGLPTTLLGYGITDAVKNAGGTPSLESGLDANKGAAATAGRVWIATDTKLIYRDNGATWDQIGGASAPSGAASGDLAGTYPGPRVAKIQNVDVSATTPLDGQVLKYSAASWAASNFSVGDLKTAAGAQQFAGSASCTSAQTLTWSSLTDTFTCSNISGLDGGAITTGTVAAARLPASASAWTVNGSDIYRSSGLVGIGTALPAHALDVSTTEPGGNVIDVRNLSSTGYSGAAFYDELGNGKGGIGYANTSAAMGAGTFYLSSFGATPLVLSTNSTEKMRIDNATGYVGIGTETPSAQLDVANGSGVALLIGADSTGTARTDANAKIARFAMPHRTNSEEPVGLLSGSSSALNNNILIGGGMASLNSATQIAFYTAPNTTTTSGSERVRIESNGYVGIGTATPRSTLDVAGSITSTASVSNASANVDFSAGNIQHTTADCGAFSLRNLKDGGSYMFVVKGTNSATCSFTAFSDNGVTPITVHLPPGHGATTVGTHTIYNLAVSSGDVYFAWTPGY
jgi:hypothetical protein